MKYICPFCNQELIPLTIFKNGNFSLHCASCKANNRALSKVYIDCDNNIPFRLEIRHEFSVLTSHLINNTISYRNIFSNKESIIGKAIFSLKEMKDKLEILKFYA